MKKSKIILIIFGIVLLIFFGFLWETNHWHDVIRYHIERNFLSVLEEKFHITKDINGDGFKEDVRFMVRRFPDHEYFNEGFVKITANGNELFQSDTLGNELEAVEINDINQDDKIEIVSKWLDGNTRYLRIFNFSKNGFQELIWASGRDVVICDFEKDGIKEIVGYWRDNNKGFNHFVGTLYKWNGKEYALLKQEIPIKIDPIRGDKLILGKGKEIVLK